MRRETQHALLLLLGVCLVQIAANGVYLRYVRPAQRGALIAAGAVTVVLAVAAMIGDARRARTIAQRGAPAHGPHPHGAVERHTPWLLLVPVLTIALAPPPALGADAVVRSGPGNAIPARDLLPPLPPGTAELTVEEFVQRAVWDTGHSVDGREVTLTGFVVRRGAATDLARLRILCCAADAQVHRVHLTGDLGDLPTDTWLRVRGTLQPGSATAADHYVPAMTVGAVTVVPAPEDPYEY